jgi:hypothetical protein
MLLCSHDITRSRNSRAIGSLGRSTGVALVLSAMLFPIGSLQNVEAQPVEPNVTEQEVRTLTEELVGQTITLRGEVEDIEEFTFRVEDERLLGGEEILVVNISGNPIPTLPDDDTALQVTGEVRTFIADEVELEYGVGLPADINMQYENKPVIFAESIALAPSPGEITLNPNRYYGKSVAVEAEIEEIISENAFTLDEEQLIDGGNLLAINTTDSPMPNEDKEVVLTGTVRLLDFAELERDYNITFNAELRNRLMADYENGAVLMVEGIYTFAED